MQPNSKTGKEKKEMPPSNHFAGGTIPYGSRDLTNKLSYTYISYLTIFTLYPPQRTTYTPEG